MGGDFPPHLTEPPNPRRSPFIFPAFPASVFNTDPALSDRSRPHSERSAAATADGPLHDRHQTNDDVGDARHHPIPTCNQGPQTNRCRVAWRGKVPVCTHTPITTPPDKVVMLLIHGIHQSPPAIRTWGRMQSNTQDTLRSSSLPLLRAFSLNSALRSSGHFCQQSLKLQVGSPLSRASGGQVAL